MSVKWKVNGWNLLSIVKRKKLRFFLILCWRRCINLFSIFLVKGAKTVKIKKLNFQFILKDCPKLLNIFRKFVMDIDMSIDLFNREKYLSKIMGFYHECKLIKVLTGAGNLRQFIWSSTIFFNRGEEGKHPLFQPRQKALYMHQHC